ncbi:MAG: helix-turn-helix transcriptional regulator, partial [Bacteroidetes bacterium]|nr:helix-turn-helix transcriptional regulator [Bacteroidota bacterium]
MQNYKQEQVSEILGLSSQQEYSKLENGKINFTDDIIFRICKAFSISPEEFMNGNLSTHILNSPNSFNHSQNNTINEKDFI